MRPITPPKRNTGIRPKVSAMGDVRIFMRFPEDWPTLRRLFATPLFSGREFFATRVLLRIITAPKLKPERKNRRTMEA